MESTANGEPASGMRERVERASMELSRALAILNLAEGHHKRPGEAEEMDDVFLVISDLVRIGEGILDEANSALVCAVGHET